MPESTRTNAPGRIGLSALDAAGTFDPDSGQIHLSLVNRLPDDELLVDLDGIGRDGNSGSSFGPTTRPRPTPLKTPIRWCRPKTRVDIDGPASALPPHSHVTLVFPDSQ